MTPVLWEPPSHTTRPQFQADTLTGGRQASECCCSGLTEEGHDRLRTAWEPSSRRPTSKFPPSLVAWKSPLTAGLIDL